MCIRLRLLVPEAPARQLLVGGARQAHYDKDRTLTQSKLL